MRVKICYTKDTEREVDSNVSLNSEVLLRFDRVRRAVKRRLQRCRENYLERRIQGKRGIKKDAGY